MLPRAVTLQEAQDIVSEYEGCQVSVTSLEEVGNAGFSRTASARMYNVVLHDPPTHYLLSTSLDETALPALSALLSNITSNTDVPMPRPLTQSVQGRWDFHWLLMSIPPSAQPSGATSTSVASLATLRPTLSPRQLAYVELRLGTYLRALHGVTNECFGTPMKPSSSEPPHQFSFPPSVFGQDGQENCSQYSWQDTFVPLLDDLLVELCESDGTSTHEDLRRKLGISVEELRQYLSRAIGAFLFDDVESPSLVWLTGNDADVLVSLSTSNNNAEGEANENQADIAYLLPTLSHALWGDPLVEAWFMPPGPSQAITEGYFWGDENGRLIVFSRQKTKRLWYTVYLALLVLVEEIRGHAIDCGKTYDQRDEEADRSEIQWAKEILPKCMTALKDAPCY